jgi:hypothetical protein
MDLKEIDLYYKCVEVDYQNEYDCLNNGCDSICRCSTIVNSEVVEVNVTKLSNLIYDKLFDDETILGKRESKLNQILYGIGKDINFYTIDRILRKYKIWEPQNYDIEICNGYYGEEIDGVFLFETIASKIEEQISIAFSIEDLSGRIEYLLGLEYGHLLPELQDCVYNIIEIDKNDINFGAIDHLSNVRKKELEHYSDKNYQGIRGLVIPTNDKYRLIDGYHRIHITTGHKVKVLNAIKKG